MSDRRTTMMAFIQCTDFHAAITRCQRSRKLSITLQKNSQSSLFEWSSTVSILSSSPCHEEIYSSLTIDYNQIVQYLENRLDDLIRRSQPFE